MKPPYFDETCIALHVKDGTSWPNNKFARAIWTLVDHIRSYETSEKYTLLCSLSELYVLFAYKTHDPEHDEYWKSVLNEVQYEKFREIGAFPLAFFKKSQDEYHDKDYVLIEFIDTLVRKNGFAEHLMYKWYEVNEDKMLLPQEPIASAVGYWRRILEDYTNEDLVNLVENDVNNVLKWDLLNLIVCDDNVGCIDLVTDTV